MRLQKKLWVHFFVLNEGISAVVVEFKLSNAVADTDREESEALDKKEDHRGTGSHPHRLHL